MKKILNMLKILLEVILVIGFIFFEELIWERAVLPIKKYLSSLGIFQKLQAWIEPQSLYATLAIFLFPLGVAEAMSLYSGVLIIKGSLIIGIVMYAIKVPVAGLTFWIFGFSRDKLLKIDWFKTLYELTIRLFDWIQSTSIYKKVKDTSAQVKDYIQNLKGEGNFSNNISHVYQSLKKLFRGDHEKS